MRRNICSASEQSFCRRDRRGTRRAGWTIDSRPRVLSAVGPRTLGCVAVFTFQCLGAPVVESEGSLIASNWFRLPQHREQSGSKLPHSNGLGGGAEKIGGGKLKGSAGTACRAPTKRRGWAGIKALHTKKRRLEGSGRRFVLGDFCPAGKARLVSTIGRTHGRRESGARSLAFEPRDKKREEASGINSHRDIYVRLNRSDAH